MWYETSSFLHIVIRKNNLWVSKQLCKYCFFFFWLKMGHWICVTQIKWSNNSDKDQDLEKFDCNNTRLVLDEDTIKLRYDSARCCVLAWLTFRLQTLIQWMKTNKQTEQCMCKFHIIRVDKETHGTECCSAWDFYSNITSWKHQLSLGCLTWRGHFSFPSSHSFNGIKKTITHAAWSTEASLLKLLSHKEPSSCKTPEWS